MTPEEFRDKWSRSTLTEKSSAQQHFVDLCTLLEVPKPADVDRTGDEYTFEKVAEKLEGSKGYADVWKKDAFVWEYKGPRRNLVQAQAQAKQYAGSLGYPPLIVVSDTNEIRVETAFNNQLVKETTVYRSADLIDPAVRRRLRWIFTDPDRWRPTRTREAVTADAAKSFANIANNLRKKGHDPRTVAHFLNRIVFCLFAEDIDLLPDRLFADILEESRKRTDDFVPNMQGLFQAMGRRDGRFGAKRVPWFNGGLFDDDQVLPLGFTDILALVDAARLDWSAIEPSIFGTLFERGLDPEKRKQMAELIGAPTTGRGSGRGAPDRGVGIHYTDPATIMKLVEPVVLRPLRDEWEAVKAEIAALRSARDKARSPAARTRAENAARDRWFAFRDRLGKFRVLDPACGSGNFLYLSLLHLKDFDRLVLREASEIGLPPDDERITPSSVAGIEINPYAAELARVTIWIGELQWQMKNAGKVERAPILGPLREIECRDALLDSDGHKANWPRASVIVGNPPFLGGKVLRKGLGDEYVDKLFAAYRGGVAAEADLVCYWFAKTIDALSADGLERAGLVATNSIRVGANRSVLDRLVEFGTIFDAWSDEPWVLDGAAVRVSLVAMSAGQEPRVQLDGRSVESIHTNLSAGSLDVTLARSIPENVGWCFQGPVKVGSFDVDGTLARKWLLEPLNPHGRSNAEVVRPWLNGRDITTRATDTWIIDFSEMSEAEAALFEGPFEYVRTNVRPAREANRDRQRREAWWRLGRSGRDLRAATALVGRIIATPRVSKHRLFVWVFPKVLPDSRVSIVARDDDTTFGILSSRYHENWSLLLGGWHGVGNDPQYTPTTGFETFPFPEGLAPNVPASRFVAEPRAQAIAAAAKRLNELRDNWLNPADLVRREPEVVPGFPDRILPINARAAAELTKRTLTRLYNDRPAWLDHAHRDLDAAVAAAYGWPADISEDDALARLFALNQERAASGA